MGMPQRIITTSGLRLRPPEPAGAKVIFRVDAQDPEVTR
jgi:hypothetical protein